MRSLAAIGTIGLGLAVLGLLPVKPPQAEPTELDYGRTCLALTMFSEARSEGPAAMYVVGSVVLARATDKRHRWPQAICDVVAQADQFQGFSTWHYPHHPELVDVVSWDSALDVADKLVANGTVSGPCSGALFFNEHGNKSAPNFKCQIGALYFYGDKP